LLGCFHCRLEIQNSGPPHPFAAIKVHTINHTQHILQFFFSLGIDICMQRDISAQCYCQHTVLAQQGQHGPADKSEGASCAHMLVVHAMQSRPCGASEFGKAQLWLARPSPAQPSTAQLNVAWHSTAWRKMICCVADKSAA